MLSLALSNDLRKDCKAGLALAFLFAGRRALELLLPKQGRAVVACSCTLELSLSNFSCAVNPTYLYTVLLAGIRILRLCLLLFHQVKSTCIEQRVMCGSLRLVS